MPAIPSTDGSAFSASNDGTGSGTSNNFDVKQVAIYTVAIIGGSILLVAVVVGVVRVVRRRRGV